MLDIDINRLYYKIDFLFFVPILCRLVLILCRFYVDLCWFCANMASFVLILPFWCKSCWFCAAELGILPSCLSFAWLLMSLLTACYVDPLIPLLVLQWWVILLFLHCGLGSLFTLPTGTAVWIFLENENDIHNLCDLCEFVLFRVSQLGFFWTPITTWSTIHWIAQCSIFI